MKKGANEATKALNRGQAEFVILASDFNPLEILLYISLCAKARMFPTLLSKQALGRSCGVSKPDISACMTQNEGYQIKPPIITIQQEMEKLLSSIRNILFILLQKTTWYLWILFCFFFTIVASYRVIWRHLVKGSIFPASQQTFWALLFFQGCTYVLLAPYGSGFRDE